MVKMQKSFMTAKDVANVMDISLSKAYKIIRGLNQELAEQGYIVIAGKIPTKYFSERCYCTNL